MDNQHKLISGYRDLSTEEIALVNEVKDMAKRVGELVDKVGRQEINYPWSNSTTDRWVNIAKTDLQKGFMSLIRAVTKPEGF